MILFRSTILSDIFNPRQKYFVAAAILHLACFFHSVLYIFFVPQRMLMETTTGTFCDVINGILYKFDIDVLLESVSVKPNEKIGLASNKENAGQQYAYLRPSTSEKLSQFFFNSDKVRQNYESFTA